VRGKRAAQQLVPFSPATKSASFAVVVGGEESVTPWAHGSVTAPRRKCTATNKRTPLPQAQQSDQGCAGETSVAGPGAWGNSLVGRNGGFGPDSGF
jgi:hypothetical protein